MDSVSFFFACLGSIDTINCTKGDHVAHIFGQSHLQAKAFMLLHYVKQSDKHFVLSLKAVKQHYATLADQQPIWPLPVAIKQ